MILAGIALAQIGRTAIQIGTILVQIGRTHPRITIILRQITTQLMGFTTTAGNALAIKRTTAAVVITTTTILASDTDIHLAIN